MKRANKIKRDTELLFEIGAFRYVDRVWKQFMNPGASNCSEHTFRVAWVALTLARYIDGADHGKTGKKPGGNKSARKPEDITGGNVDISKLLKMALLHDMAESRCGDVHYLSRQYVERKEIKAIEDIFEGTIHGREMAELIREYEDRKTLEAKLVKDADNLDVQLELKEFQEKGSSLARLWEKKRREKVYPKLYTNAAKKFWNEIRKANVHGWHNDSPWNRFNGGDWKKKSQS